MSGPVVVLAGGTGGAKLARGLLEVLGEDELVVIANTADDLEIYGAYVSPDPDLVTLWLADRIDARGWGVADDTFAVMDGLRALGQEIWFNLGDADLALGIRRAEALAAGARLTEAHAELVRALGVKARVLPMSDRPVRTRILARGRWWAFQEFMIIGRGEGPVQDVEFRGARAAPATPEVLESLVGARAILIGPSNPVISIGPILATPGVSQAIRESSAPVVAVSPLVGGRVVKGPTAPFMHWARQALDASGIATTYAGVIDGLVSDEPAATLPTLVTDVLMDSAGARERLAAQALRFAISLSG